MKNYLKQLIYVFSLLVFFSSCDQDDGYSSYDDLDQTQATEGSNPPPVEEQDPELCPDTDPENCPE